MCIGVKRGIKNGAEGNRCVAERKKERKNETDRNKKRKIAERERERGRSEQVVEKAQHFVKV